MARNADDDVLQPAPIWRLIVEPSSERFAFALRLATICALTAIIAEIYQTPEIALTAYVAFFLNKPDRTSSVLLSLVITIVITLVLTIIFVLAGGVLDDPKLRVLTMTFISFAMMFLASASKLKPLASTVALVLAYSLDLLGNVPLGEAATRALLYAWLFVGIPALVSIIVNLLIAPSPRGLIQKDLAECLRTAAEALEDDASRTNIKLNRLIQAGDSDLQKHLKLASLEKTSPHEETQALEGASDCVVTVLAAIQIMISEPDARPSPSVVHSIRGRLDELVSIFAAGGYPANVEPIDADSQCTDLAISSIAFLNSGLLQFGEPRPKKNASHSSDHSGFFASDAFSNPIHVQFAIKTTAAAMFCYLVYSVLSWPGIHTALITCFIVSLGTAAESVEKLTLRIVGCLIGASLGLAVMVYIIPHLTDIGGLAALVFMGAFLGAWIAAGHKRISYAGLQIAFAYFLCVIQGSGPSFNMVVARDRVIGILFGNVVSYFVATRIWPISVGPHIDTAMKSIKHHLESIACAVDSWSRRRLAAETHSKLDAIADDLHLAAYEPPSIRPQLSWLEQRRYAIDQAQQLESPLLAVVELTPRAIGERISASLEDGSSLNREFSQESMLTSMHLRALEALLNSRIVSFQNAMSSLNQMEEHG